jgi:hypothetical protein
MVQRTVQLAGITYRSAEDAPNLMGGEPLPVMEFAQLGDVVDVHESYVKRFDLLNEEYVSGPANPRLAFREEVARNQPAGPQPTDHGQGAVEDPEDEDIQAAQEAHVASQEPKRPRNKANLSEWQDYAEARGVEIQDDDGNFKTKAALIEETDADDEEEDDQIGV